MIEDIAFTLENLVVPATIVTQLFLLASYFRLRPFAHLKSWFSVSLGEGDRKSIDE